MPNQAAGCLCFSGEVMPIRYEIWRASNTNVNTYNPVFVGANLRNTRNPQWVPEKINIAKLCNADELIPFRFIFFSGPNRLGYCQTNLKECNDKKALQFVSEGAGQAAATVTVMLN
jgi:hypothetical protein